MKSVTLFFILFINLFLTACGGGDTSPDSTNTTTTGKQTIKLTPQYSPSAITGYGIEPTVAYTETANNVYYLDANTGDDVNGDGTSNTPWKTLNKIFTVMGSGDTIILRSGNYGRFSQNISNNRTDWITFKADTGHAPVIAGLSLVNSVLRNTYLRFDNIDFIVGGTNSIYGVSLTYVKHFEIRNSNISNYIHKYETDSGFRVKNSENILIYYCDISKASRSITVSDTHNLTFSRNHIHNLSGSSAINYGGGNGNFIIEKNNVYDSNFDTNDVDSNSPYIAGNISSFPHSSGVAIRSNDVWIRGNIFHDVGSSSGIMFYTPDAAGGETVYNNIVIENNLFYDIHNPSIIRMFNVGANIVLRNNTIVGHLRDDTTNANYRLRTAILVQSLASGYDGSGLLVYNNIMAGSVMLPQTAKTGNNIFWTYSLYDNAHSFLSIPPDLGTKIMTSQATDYPIGYFTNNFFTGIDAEIDFAGAHHQKLDYHLTVNSEAVYFGDVATQSSVSLGSINANGFIQDDGPVRDAEHNSVGAYQFTL